MPACHGHLQGLAAWLGRRLFTRGALLLYFSHLDGFFLALFLFAKGSPGLAVSARSRAVLWEGGSAAGEES